MITQEEKDEIIGIAVEKSVLMFAKVIGNLIMDHFSQLKINRDFYLKYPEFRDKKDVVQSVVEAVQSENPSEAYDKLIELAVPRIKERIKQVGKMDISDVPRPDRTYHGEL